jgi:hypothetical protein
MHTIKKKNVLTLKKGDTFKSEDGYCHVFEDLGITGVITEDGEVVEYSDEISVTIQLSFPIETIKQAFKEAGFIVKEDVDWKGAFAKEFAADLKMLLDLYELPKFFSEGWDCGLYNHFIQGTNF